MAVWASHTSFLLFQAMSNNYLSGPPYISGLRACSTHRATLVRADLRVRYGPQRRTGAQAWGEKSACSTSVDHLAAAIMSRNVHHTKCPLTPPFDFVCFGHWILNVRDLNHAENPPPSTTPHATKNGLSLPLNSLAGGQSFMQFQFSKVGLTIMLWSYRAET